MPPEQARGEWDRVDERADVFALGAILCKVLTGKPPYSTEWQILNGNLTECFTSLDRSGSDAELIDLAKRLLETSLEKRLRNAQVVLDAVRAYKAGMEARERAEREARVAAEVKIVEERKRRRWQLALAGAVLLLVAGGLTFAWREDQQADKRRTAELQQKFEVEQRAAGERERLARNGEAAAALLGQCENALKGDDAAKAEPALTEAEARRREGGTDHLADRFARCRTDLDMLRDLDRINDLIWTPVAGKPPNSKKLVAAWQEAFTRFGIVRSTTPSEESVRRINASLVRDPILTALDQWLLRSPGAADVLAILRAADADPFRSPVREAVKAQNAQGISELAEKPEALAQPARFAVVLGSIRTIPLERQVLLLRTALDRQPGNFTVLMTLGEVYLINNQADRVVEREGWNRAALAVRPAKPVAWHNLGIALTDKKDYVEAIKAFREALQLDPELAFGHYNLAFALVAKKEYGEAIKVLREAIRLDPTNASAHHNLGFALNANKEYVKAIEAYGEAIRLDPKYAIAYNNLGIALTANKEYGKAITAFRDAIQIDRKNAGAHNNLVIALYANKNYIEAIEAFGEAIRLDPKYAIGHYDRGKTLNAKKDYDGAIEAFKKAIRLDPKYAEAHNGLGIAMASKVALTDKKDYEGAIASFREASRLDPKFVRNLGNALFLKGDFDGAIVMFQEAVRLDPKNEEIKKTLDSVKKMKAERDAKPAPPPRKAKP